MRLSLRQLQIFTAIADTGSTTAASSRVALSQSATSGALNELEGLLGTRLFDRIGKRLVLNDSGRALLPQARSLLDGAQAIESQFGVGRAGGVAMAAPLRVAASTTIGNYLLPALVARYLSLSPSAHVDITIGNTSDVASSVAKLEVDLGFIEGPCHEPDLHAEPWLDDELVVVCAPSYPLHQPDMSAGTVVRPGARVGVKTLRQQRWLLREPGSGTREAVENALLPHLHQWSSSMELGSTEAIKQAAAEGLGLACLSLCAVSDLITLKRLVVVDSTLPRLARRLYMVHHRQKHFSASLATFVAHCRTG